MKYALILHGIEGHAGDHWEKWLADQLTERNYKVFIPQLPNSNNPDREEWLRAINDILQNINLENLTIIGHSLGATIALDFIEKIDRSVGKLISVSGFAEDYGCELNQKFLSKKHINFEKVKKNLKSAVVIYGDDDPYVPQKELKYLADGLDIKPHVIHKGGHLNTDTGYTKFPLLLKFIS